MYKSGVNVRVLANGRPVREYSKNGLTFIESRNGSSYTIKVGNDNAFRVMVIVSVDGLDVITGKAAEDSNQGYLINAYSSTEIKGYRLSDDTSAAFVFTSKDESYVANATGDARNSGVIGVRVFEEKEQPKPIIKEIHHHHWDHAPVKPWVDPWVDPYYPKYPWRPWPYNPIWYSSGTLGGTVRSMGASGQSVDVSYNCSAEPSHGDGTAVKGVCASSGVSAKEVDQSVNHVANASAANDFDTPIKYDSFDMGTTWGEKQDDRVRKEVFHRGKVVAEIVVYYASSEALKNMGIDLTDTPRITEAPKAFGDSQYCRPPTGWNG